MALRTLDGSYTNALYMTWCSMLQALAPSLERQPSASAAWLMAVAQTGGDQFYQTIFYIQGRCATQGLPGMFGVPANSVQLSPRAELEIEKWRMSPSFASPIQPLVLPFPHVMVGRTILARLHVQGRGFDRTSARKLPEARPDRPLSEGIDAQDWRISLIGNKSYTAPLLIPISTLLEASCMLIHIYPPEFSFQNMCNFGKIYRPMATDSTEHMKSTTVLHEMSSQE